MPKQVVLVGPLFGLLNYYSVVTTNEFDGPEKEICLSGIVAVIISRASLIMIAL